MLNDRSPELTAWLAFLGTSNCTCPYRYTSLGTLDRISMGNGWVRTADDPSCPIHPQTGRDQ